MINPNNIPEVCKVSVYTIVLTPPLNVYNKIMASMISVVAQKGIFMLSKINPCKILTTKNNRAVAPSVRDKIKNEAPLL